MCAPASSFRNARRERETRGESSNHLSLPRVITSLTPFTGARSKELMTLWWLPLPWHFIVDQTKRSALTKVTVLSSSHICCCTLTFNAGTAKLSVLFYFSTSCQSTLYLIYVLVLLRQGLFVILLSLPCSTLCKTTFGEDNLELELCKSLHCQHNKMSLPDSRVQINWAKTVSTTSHLKAIKNLTYSNNSPFLTFLDVEAPRCTFGEK